eukprot:CAMPEP_0195518034 /NCGR_PEP_ID=MMETSP0794_2-20130614/12001_1 /TAXON_ID=515487 /ORGANISM="Stephanopyxis turris, Strain CCMP 815" /LENGTH=336 /DNA_ID=CAMNT_0040646931 /DNA_START=75 /DNA_END=1085 /DNA_ORIENTATION=-
MGWADENESSDEETPIIDKSTSTSSIPPTHTSRVDSKGIKTVTSYRAHPSKPKQLIKTITKIRVTKTLVRENRAVEHRRQWKRFGQAAIDEDQSNITIQSRDDVYLEDPKADVDKSDEDPAKALAGNLNAFWAKQQQRQLERKYDVDVDVDVDVDGGAAPQEDGWSQVGPKGSGGGAGGKYVPPSMRGGAGAGGKSLAAMAEASGGGDGSRRFDDRDQNTIRVTNISEDTTEADLQELFQPFGRISRVYLAKDKETLVSRGFAFVSFVHRDDAQKAMDKLQGFGYDHLILKLEWAKPSAPKDPGTEGTQYRSGYGKALAQDTKEKVSYASNLTQNR